MNVELKCMTDFIYCLPLESQAKYVENRIKCLSNDQVNDYVDSVVNGLPGPCQIVSGQTVANLAYIYQNTSSERVMHILHGCYSNYNKSRTPKFKLNVNRKYVTGVLGIIGSVLFYSLYRKYK